MTKEYKLAYGKELMSVQIPDKVKTEFVENKKLPVIKSIPKEVRAVLDEPIKSPPLKEILNPSESVVIIISDITRLSYNTSGYLPILLDYLNETGISDEDITIVVATGMHRQHTLEEDQLVVGKEVYNRVKIENHDAKADDLVDLGQTTRGTKITVNRTVYEADHVILTGGISYHLLAGFGGGRKSIAPGVCGYKSIQQNHALALTGQNTGINSSVAAGILKGNPVSEDMFEIASKVGVDFMINVVVNEKKEYIKIVAGDLHQAFLEGCKVVEQAFSVPVDSKSDLVISSCGGYPKDIQLYQSIKGLNNSAYAIREGGVIILSSMCSDGTGSEEFMKWFDYANPEEMREELDTNFSMPGFVALRAATIMANANVILISSLDEEIVKGVNMIPADSMEEAWEKANDILEDIESITIMPQSSLTFPMIN